MTFLWLFYLKSNDNAAYMWVIKKKKKMCSAEKILSFAPNRTVEVRLNSSAKPNVRSITNLMDQQLFCWRHFSKIQVVQNTDLNILAL